MKPTQPKSKSPRSKSPTRKQAELGRPARAASVFGWGDLPTSLLFIFPLFLAYEIGVVFAPAMNGVDFVSRNLFALVHYSRRYYLCVHAGLAVVFVILLFILRRRGRFHARAFLPMLLESGVYALTLGSLIWFVMHKVFGMTPALAIGKTTPGTAVVLSLGAGVHEELVFRLGLCAGGASLFRLFGMKPRAAMSVAFTVSSALFSGAHFLGAFGDPFSVQLFVYRFLAGLLFATIFYFRSLSHAAYTHALYDLYVMVIH
jgi:hypothetical protein